MWEFWRSRLSKGKTRHRRRVGSDGEESPTVARVESLQASLPGPPENSTHIYFRDVILPASDDESGDDDDSERESCSGTEGEGGRRMARRRKQRVDRQKLIIILVGLPGRGKTFLCNKLLCYLNWLGHQTKHFNVGQYRRMQRGEDEVQDASFFDHNNPAGMLSRERALYAALDEMESWLATENAQCAIFDATNSTEERRRLLRNRFHLKWQYLFIESICNDEAVLEQNYRFKMMYSPDYVKCQDTEEALDDFKERIRKYEEVYETITDRNLHYIKLIDMVTGRGYMDVNRISGYIPGKIVFFLMQVCKAGVARLRKIWLTRHGESMYNLAGKLGGDSLLGPRGEAYARLLPDVIVDRIPLTSEGLTMPVSVWTSTLKRTINTAELLPFPKLRWKVLDEIQAGLYDGMTYEQIEEQYPEEYAARKRDKLRYRYPAGESYMDVIQRLEPVIIEIERERECVCVVAHQAVLRALYGYFTKTPLSEIPRLEIPLHTLIELVPKPDGRMAEERIHVDVARETISQGSNELEAVTSMSAPFTPFTPLTTTFADLAAARGGPSGCGVQERTSMGPHSRSSSSLSRWAAGLQRASSNGSLPSVSPDPPGSGPSRPPLHPASGSGPIPASSSLPANSQINRVADRSPSFDRSLSHADSRSSLASAASSVSTAAEMARLPEGARDCPMDKADSMICLPD